MLFSTEYNYLFQCNLIPSYGILTRASVSLGARDAARSSSGHDVREITGYSIRGFSVIEFESLGSRALIVRVTLDISADSTPSISATVIHKLWLANDFEKCRKSLATSTRKSPSASDAINCACIKSFCNLIICSTFV